MTSFSLLDFFYYSDKIQFYFVTKSGTVDDASETLKHSFQMISEISLSTNKPFWISETLCIYYIDTQLSKQYFFVLEEFEGPAFERLSSSKGVVIGPRAIIDCKLKNIAIPSIFSRTSSPICTLAMKDFIVCLSGISKEKRDKIHKLVGYMGGLSSKDLIEGTTHLITNTTMSPKYQVTFLPATNSTVTFGHGDNNKILSLKKAAEKKLKIVPEKWVFDVWSLSKIDDNSYRTTEFYEKYKFPIFSNLVITSTGISEADKNEIANWINNNGGTYSGSFNSKETDILIAQPNQKDSRKFKAAVKCRKECLLIDWVKDSASKGYMLPFLNYRIYTGQSAKESIPHSTQSSDVENVSVSESKPVNLNYLKSLDDANDDPKEQAPMPDSIQTVPSPANRKNINPFRRPVNMLRMLNMNDDDDVDAQREGTNVCGETAEETDQIDPELFRGVIFALLAFSEESTAELLMEIEEAGGTTVALNDFTKTVDYLIVPSDTYDIGACKYEAKEIVTDLWIQECLGDNVIVDIKYYHRPILIAENCKPLLDLRIVISTYTTPERDFLTLLAQALGAVVNNRYMGHQKPVLICPNPHGNKYLGAVKWQLPVVTGEWLEECLIQRTKVPMEKFAVLERKRLHIVEKTNEGNENRQQFEKSDSPKTPLLSIDRTGNDVTSTTDVNDRAPPIFSPIVQ